MNLSKKNESKIAIVSAFTINKTPAGPHVTPLKPSTQKAEIRELRDFKVSVECTASFRPAWKYYLQFNKTNGNIIQFHCLPKYFGT